MTDELRRLLEERNKELRRLKEEIGRAIHALKRGDHQDALLTLIAATLQNDPHEWAPKRDK